jgi:hypothetical protein
MRIKSEFPPVRTNAMNEKTHFKAREGRYEKVSQIVIPLPKGGLVRSCNVQVSSIVFEKVLC